MHKANANPDKRFFIDLMIRDISLEDAILDLIDNAIDSLVRVKNIDPYTDLLNSNKSQTNNIAEIHIDLKKTQVEILDNCGGISFKRAKEDIFRFGHPDPQKKSSLSVFGIGMKRAIFKIGKQIYIESNETESGFSMDLNVDEWMEDKEQNWSILIDQEKGTTNPDNAGTKIIIKNLRNEIVNIITNQTFLNRLTSLIRESYPFHLDNYVEIFLNKKKIEPLDLTIADSETIQPATESWTDGNVDIRMIVGLLPKSDSKKWRGEQSGWYLVCNGRVIVNADKTKLTGWGNPLPQFQPKNRGFLGIVFFTSEYPEELPWKTTKRDINSESPVYVNTFKKMVSTARPVLNFQDKLYKSGDDEEPKEEYRKIVSDLPGLQATQKASTLTPQGSTKQVFTQSPSSTPTKKTTRVAFDVNVEDIKKVKKHLGKSSMSNKEAGLKIFKYFKDRECPE